MKMLLPKKMQLSCVKESKPPDVTHDHGEVNDEEEKDETKMITP